MIRVADPIVSGVLVATVCVVGSLLADRARQRSVALRARRVVGARLGTSEPVANGALVWAEALRRVRQHRRWARRLRARREARQRSADLPVFVDVLARSVESGSSVRDALLDGAEVVGGPIVGDVTTLERRIAAGVTFDDALLRWEHDSSDDGVSLVITAVRLGVEFGSGLAASLGGIAATLADRHEIAAEARASTSQARASAVMLGAMPVGCVLITSLVDPGVVSTLLGTPVGWACLTGAAFLDGLGFLWMRALIGGVR